MVKLLLALAVMMSGPHLMKSSMKGWELYSWRDGSQLRYALVIGTNRNKTAAEIQHAVTADLDKALAGLAKGEEVIWSAPAGFELPDPATRQHVVDLAKKLQLKLTI